MLIKRNGWKIKELDYAKKARHTMEYEKIEIQVNYHNFIYLLLLSVFIMLIFILVGRWDRKVEKPAKTMKERCGCNLGAKKCSIECSEIAENFRKQLFHDFRDKSWQEKKVKILYHSVISVLNKNIFQNYRRMSAHSSILKKLNEEEIALTLWQGTAKKLI